ncbi:serine hydrolase domain-containing protein [Phytomonospora endophytica]|uniref:CubicO group peptidase (Beta-lactamase class C family) n=1 Tax=Phytomonospora endophytica TaxID=714109 RepID=A0A841FME4_9ACTN|nr:serine hydrolase domain-containing protein [Phytomonospora endophytica]MBB6033779.1 CubicO group peptidase (beta-lactamase class C family) [Phytomonospora endophytica]GIG64703.1 serine hydrolase [Phytomonospora endophytica]
MTTTHIQGTVAEGYADVRDAFTDFTTGQHTPPDAQLAAYVHGRLVVDLWTGDDINGDTLTGVYSATKGAAYLTVALLVQDGVLDLDDTVASHWPAFGAHGKDRLTLRQLLAHQAGVPGVDGGLTPAELADDRAIAVRVAAQAPYWEPGTAYGYHAYVVGALIGEVVLRATGRGLREHYEERLRVPFGLDLHVGLPAELEERFREIKPWVLTPEQEAELWSGWPGAGSVAAIAYNLDAEEPTDPTLVANDRRMRALGQFSAGGVGSAQGLAGLYDAALRLLDPRTVAVFTAVQSTGNDLVSGMPARFNVGFENLAQYPALGGDAFGHSGTPGSLGFADPRSGVAYGYTRRRCTPAFYAPEHQALTAAIVRAAGRTSKRMG